MVDEKLTRRKLVGGSCNLPWPQRGYARCSISVRRRRSAEQAEEISAMRGLSARRCLCSQVEHRKVLGTSTRVARRQEVDRRFRGKADREGRAAERYREA